MSILPNEKDNSKKRPGAVAPSTLSLAYLWRLAYQLYFSFGVTPMLVSATKHQKRLSLKLIKSKLFFKVIFPKSIYGNAIVLQ